MPKGSLDPERLRQIEELYHSAQKRDGSSRMSFLTDACGSDEELRREVESLLEQNAHGSPLAILSAKSRNSSATHSKQICMSVNV